MISNWSEIKPTTMTVLGWLRAVCAECMLQVLGTFSSSNLFTRRVWPFCCRWMPDLFLYPVSWRKGRGNDVEGTLCIYWIPVCRIGFYLPGLSLQSLLDRVSLASCPKMLEGEGLAAVKHLPPHSTFIREVDKVIYVWIFPRVCVSVCTRIKFHL